MNVLILQLFIFDLALVNGLLDLHKSIMSFILQTNFERKNFNSEIRNEAASMSIKDDKLVENLRNLVKEYLEIVSVS